MGYFKHDIIVVTSYSAHEIEKLHQYAHVKFDDYMVSKIMVSPINSFYTFFVGPDGSKEGWDNSDIYDGYRDTFCEFVQSHSSAKWAHYALGDDEEVSTKVVKSWGYEMKSIWIKRSKEEPDPKLGSIMVWGKCNNPHIAEYDYDEWGIADACLKYDDKDGHQHGGTYAIEFDYWTYLPRGPK